MAVTQNQYTGNGNTVLFSFTFPYLAATDVKVKINGVTQATTEYSLANATTIQMNSAPANGATVLIFRDTDNDNKQATFYPGSAIKAEDLNNNIDQILYTAQEVDNNAMSTTGDDAMTGDLNLGGNKATNMGAPTSGTDGVNKTHLDSTIDTAIESDVLVGTDLSKSASGGQVTISHNVTGANTTINNSAGNVVQDITISAQGHVTSAGSTNLDDRYYTENELNAGQLDNRYFTETELSGGQLNNLYYTETELDSGQLDNRYYTETELNNGQLDTRYHTKSELNTGALDTRYFRQDSSETITSGATWSGSDNFIATTGAIDARIIDLVDDVGGFVPIANETSFPATNPDVNNGTGTLVSIKTISSERTPSGGSVVITDGAGSGNDVTITGLGTTVLPAGYGVIVETTGTTHTYTFHRLSPDATSVTAVSAIPNEIATVAGISTHVQTVSGINNDVQVVSANNSNVTTVAGSITSVNTAATNLDQIQNFANVYRIVSSDPTTSLNAGDLIFNTTSNLFKVYNGSAWVDGVSSVGAYGDNTKLTFGDGNDLEIYHSTNNVIQSNGLLLISSDNTNNVKIMTRNMSQNSAIFKPNGAAELYYDGSNKFQTLSTGAQVTGNLGVGTSPSHLIHAKNSSVSTTKIVVESTGTNSYPAFRVINDARTYDLGIDGATDAFRIYDVTGTAERLVIESGGNIKIPSDSGRLKFGASQDLEIYHNGTNSHLRNNTGSFILNGSEIYLMNTSSPYETYLSAVTNGAISLYYDNSKKLETTSTGISVSGHINLPDQASGTGKLKCGDGNDLQIYHDGTDSYIQNETNDLFIDNNGDDIVIRTVDTIFFQVNNSENTITAKANGAVELYYDNDKRFETSTEGAVVYGPTNTTTSFKITGAEGRSAEIRLIADEGDDFTDTCRLHKSINGRFYLWNATASGVWESMLVAVPNGAVELYYDDSKKLETTSDGVAISQETGNAYLRVKALENNSSASARLRLETTSNDANSVIEFGDPNDSDVGKILYNHQTDGSDILSFTVASGEKWRMTHDGHFENNSDSGKIKLGASDDLEIYHDGTNSFIENSVGSLYIRDISGGDVRIQGKSGEDSIICNDDGSVELYEDDSKRLETTSTGVTMTGTEHKFTSTTSGDCTVIIEADSDNNEEGDNPKLVFRQDGGSDQSAIYLNNNLLNIANSVNSSGGIAFKTGTDVTAPAYENAGTRMLIQPNGEIAMRSSGEPSDALANLHVQNDTFRVSNDSDGATTTYFVVNALTHATDNDRWSIGYKSGGDDQWSIRKDGAGYFGGSISSGRTRGDGNSPINTFHHGAFSVAAYSGCTHDTTLYRNGIFMRAWDADDNGDRNIIYYTNSGSDTTGVDYDQHQKFGVKADGAVNSGSNIFAGRVESDEASPNSVYNGGNGTLLAVYPGTTAQQSQFRARTSDSNSEYTIYIDSGAGLNFKLSSSGRLYRDNTSEYSPADYAEMFEWKDGNTSSEIRTGMTVVLEDEMIRPATSSDDPSKIIGVVSANPVIIGDAAPLSYKDKHLKDAYGGWVYDNGTEMLIWNKFGTDFIDGKKVPRAQPDPTDPNCNPDYSVPVADIETEKAKGKVPQAAIDQNIRMTVKNRLPNPNYDPNKTYVPRMDRKEWDAIGLLGKLVIRRGQPVGANWILMKSNVGVDPTDKTTILDKYLVR